LPNALRIGTAAVLGAVLLACSGSRKADPGPTFIVTPLTLAFTAASGAPAPPAQVLDLAFPNDLAVHVGATFIGTGPGWLVTPVPAMNGTFHSWKVNVQVGDTGLAPGTYTCTLRVGGETGDNFIIGIQDIPITYTVTPAPTAAGGSN